MMGYYINPKNTTNALWLLEFGQVLNSSPLWKDVQPGLFPVCLIDGGLHLAAGIAYNEREMEDFSRDCGRDKIWYLCKISDLVKVCPELMRRPDPANDIL